MRKLISNLIILAALVIAFYIVKGMVDPVVWGNFWTFMAGDYPEFYDTHLRNRMPGFTHPLVLLFIATFVILLMLRKRG